MSTEKEELTLTIPEVAKILRIGRTTAYEAVRTGQIPSLRFGRVIRVPRHALESLLSAQGTDGKR